MAYLRKLSSLEDMAASQLAIHLCQDASFKEVAMCLEKPVTNFNFWLLYNMISLDEFKYNSILLKEWGTAIDEQCQRLMKSLPHSLRHEVHVWMTRIAVEYASYTQRMELLFNIPRYFFMNILTLRDWTETGRVNEKRLAKRLLTEERLTVLQQYRIACVYCLHKSIPHLWNRLTSEEKQLISGEDDPSCSQEKNPFVLLWSYFMDGRREEKVTRQKNHLWTYASLLAVHYGNQAALMQCWKRLNKHSRTHILMKRALQSLEKWEHIRNKDKWGVKLATNVCRSDWGPEPVEHFNLPSYYSELLRFFLSKMSERQQLRFFNIAFEFWKPSRPGFHILDCLLEWPLQDHFLETVNRLWGIIPKEIYGRCLLSLAVKHSGNYDSHRLSSSFYEKDDLYYDYRSMLWNLWEETPEEYKQYVFSQVLPWDHCYKPVIEDLLPLLLTRSPLQEKDVALFKRIWHDVPQEGRKAAMYEKDGRNICSILMEKEMWFFINGLLEECLPDGEIPSFKLNFTESYVIYKTCFIKLQENCEKYVEGFIDWAFESDTDKLRFKYEIIKYHGMTHCSHLLSTGEYIELERIINFCLSSEEIPSFKVKVAELNGHLTCFTKLEENCEKYVEDFIDWAFESDAEKLQFKYEMITRYGVSHCSDLLSAGEYAELQRIINFCLSSEEIPSFKVKVAELNGHLTCFTKLEENCEKYVEDFIDWAFESDAEKLQFKYEMIKRYGVSHCSDLLSAGEYAELERIINFCLSSEEIPSFKVKVAELNGHLTCFTKLEENCEKYVEDFIDWAFESDAEKLQFKYEMITRYGVSHCSDLLSAGEYAKVECIINFCLSSEEIKLQFKVNVVKKACHNFLKDCAWMQMDKSISWIFDAEEKISNFKKDLFYSENFVFQIHLKLVFNQNPLWENVECFYKWFCLSPEEIIELKKKTAFTSRVIDVVHKALCGTMDTFYQKTYGELDVIITSLRWCLTDEQMVISFKEKIEKHFLKKKGTRNNNKGKQQVGYLVSELFRSFPKEAVHERTIGGGQFMKDKVEKKSLMMKEDKFNSTRKRFKKAP